MNTDQQGTSKQHITSAITVRKMISWKKSIVCGLIVVMLVCLIVLNGYLPAERIHRDANVLHPVVHVQDLEYPEEKYNIIPNVISPHGDISKAGTVEITLCTQTSLSNLFQTISMAKMWKGRISIAVFAYDEYVHRAVQYIMLLRRCSPDVNRHVHFHLVVPVMHSPAQLNTSEDIVQCYYLSGLKDKYSRVNYEPSSVPYPVNVLRNVALMYASTPYVFNIDVDFLPSRGLKREMEAFLNSLNDTERQRKYMYVLPCFESQRISDMHVLNSKHELIRSVKEHTVRQYTVTKCDPCQAPTDYDRWLSVKFPSAMDIAYSVAFKPRYEPFYIAYKHHLPMFNGIFKQYGANRVSQVCEAYISGFDFAVMNNGYLVHDGFKGPTLQAQWKMNQSRHNALLLENVFKPGLKYKYPNSTRTC